MMLGLSKIEILEILIDKEIDPNRKLFDYQDKRNLSDMFSKALKEACKQGNLPIIKELLLLENNFLSARSKGNIVKSMCDKTLAGVKYFIGENALKKLRYLAGLPPLAPSNLSRAISWAASCGHLEAVRYLTSLDGADPAIFCNEPLRLAAQYGHFEVVEYLTSLQSVNAATLGNSAICNAASNGHLNIVKFLASLEAVNPAAREDMPIRMAAASGCFEVVQYLAGLDKVNPAAKNNSALIWAAQNGHLNTVKFLVSLESVKLVGNQNKALSLSICKGHTNIVRFFLTVPEVSVTPENIAVAQRCQYKEIKKLLEDKLKRQPRWQLTQLKKAKEALFEQRTEELSGPESALNDDLEGRAVRQKTMLSKKYVALSVEDGLHALKQLVFGALLERLSLEASLKRDFLKKNMKALIDGDEQALEASKKMFSSNEDIYEMAFRALNAKSPCKTWPNLLTQNSDAGLWVQEYAGYIACEIAASKEKPYYKDCVFSLIDRLAEIRRANNNGSRRGIDIPSCFPGTKSRLVTILEPHPAYRVTSDWVLAFYEGASRYVQSVFRQSLDKTESPEEAEFFLDSILLMNLENATEIESGQPIMMVSGDRKLYTFAHAGVRLEFIQNLEKNFLSSVNAYLSSVNQTEIRKEDSKRRYISFAMQGLGEDWIRQGLSDIYAKYAPRRKAFTALYQPTVEQEAKRAKLSRKCQIQALKSRFYHYCDSNNIELSMSPIEINNFFSTLKKFPTHNDLEQAFFDGLLAEIQGVEKKRHLALDKHRSFYV